MGTGISLHHGDLPDDVKFTKQIAVDTEAMGLVRHRDRLCLVQIATESGEVHLVKFNGVYDAPNLKAVLADEDVLKIFHFARFDVSIIRYYLGIWAYPCYCTHIASRLARTYTDGHGLKTLCSELLGVKLDKLQQSSDWGKSDFTKEQLDYAAFDVIYLHKVRDILNKMLVREKRDEVAQSCFDFVYTRVELDLMGWDDVDVFSHKVV